MRRSLDILYKTAGILACLFLIAIAVLTALTIINRIFRLGLYSTEEFAGWSMAASTFLGLASTLRTNEHIRVSLLIDRMAPGARHVIEILSLLIATGLMGIFAWFAVDGMMDSQKFGEMTQGVVPVPLWIPQIGMALGAAVMFVALLDDLISAARGRRPSYQAVSAPSLTESI